MMTPTWTKSTKYLIIILILIICAWIISYAAPLIGPIIIAALLAYLLSPIVELLSNLPRISRRFAVALTYALFLILLMAIPYLVTPILIRQLTNLTIDLVKVETQVMKVLTARITFQSLELSLGQFLGDFDQFFRESLRNLPGDVINLLGNVTTNLVWVLVTLVTTFYLLNDGPKLREWVISLVHPNYQTDTRRLLTEIDRAWSAFLRGQLVLMFSVGILTGLGAALLGLQAALLIGLIAGVLDVIPSLGPMVAGLVSVVVALAFGSSNLTVSNIVFGLIILVLFIVIQQIENIWLRPQIMGSSLHLHPALVFIGVLGTLTVVGVIGALVIIPIMSTISILGRYTHARLLDQDPWEKTIEKPQDTASVDFLSSQTETQT